MQALLKKEKVGGNTEQMIQVQTRDDMDDLLDLLDAQEIAYSID